MSPHAPALKALHVISGDLWAGAEVQAFNLLTALHEIDGVEVAAALLNEGELANRLRARGIRVAVFDEARLNAASILVALGKLMREWHPNVVHTHRTKENVLGALANRLTENVQSLRTAHGAPEHSPRGLRQLHKKIFQWLDQWSGRRLQAATVAVSAELERKLHAYLPATRTVVIENGVDVEGLARQIHPVEFRERRPGATHLGIVGRLVPVKRIDLFLEMASLLRQRDTTRDWRFHIFGDGPRRAHLAQLAEQHRLADVTTFHGHRDDIASCIAALDALVMCSDHEGMPMTLLEAMTLGTPVIGHATGGIAQLLDGERCGWPAAEHNAAAYADAVGAALTNTESRTARARAARENIHRHYSAAHCARQHVKLYRRLVQGEPMDNATPCR